MANIKEILSQRSDLSTFLVHMTKDVKALKAPDVLKAILKSGKIEARNPFGPAVNELKAAKISTASQNCVCFTETPLLHLRLLLGEIEGRAVRLRPYGIAMPKKVGRSKSVNPIWYLDQTPGAPEWLGKAWAPLITVAIKNHAKQPFDKNPISKLTPFIEQMGTWPTKGTMKEFWWEREWRKRGDFFLPSRVIVIAPELEHGDFRRFIDELGTISAVLIDASWSLEQIIGGLAGFEATDLGL